jgi:hypothetical protein
MATLPLSAVYTFVAGIVHDRNTIRVLAQADALNAHGNLNTTFLKFLVAEDKKVSFHVLFTLVKLIAIQTPESTVIAVGPDGRVNVGTAKGEYQEQIGTPKEGPSVHGLIRDLRLIGSDVIAVGMGRQAYRRGAPCKWTPFHKGILQDISLTEVRGFNAVHGLSEREFVAVGWYGEIYRWNEKSWVREESNTNVILNDVHVTPNGRTYVGGQKGLILQNSGAGWELGPHDFTDDEIRSLQWFGDKLYIATDDALFAMDSRGRVNEVKVSGDASTFDSLHAGDGVLLSVGAKDICWTNDAKHWHRLD